MRKRIRWCGSILLVTSLAACSTYSTPDDIDPTLDPNESVTGLPGQVDDPTQEVVDPEDNNLVRGNAYINTAELIIMESYPIQVMLSLTGDLPTPCQEFAFTVADPEEGNQIHVEVYSLGEEGIICIQVLQPFEENISISSLDTPLEDGSYTVWVNGEWVGEFNYPGG